MGNTPTEAVSKMGVSRWTKVSAIFLFVWTLSTPATGQSLVQNGKVNFTGAYPHTVHCKTVLYPRTFSSSGVVRVLAAVSHGEESSSIHDSAVVWTAGVTRSSFRVCMMETGVGTNGSADVNWLAYQGTPTGMLGGVASFATFTSGTKCKRVDFAQRFSSVPTVLATVSHAVRDRTQDAMNMWIEELQQDHLRICLREVRTFDGKHENVKVHWLAFLREADLFTFQGKLLFDNVAAPLEQNNFAYCKVVNFTKTFYAPPVVIVTANHQYNSSNANAIKPENNVINAWIEEVTVTAFQVCVKDLAGMESQHDPITVDYVVVGDLDPCIDVSCNNYAVCKAFGPRDARCVCVELCPSFEQPVCSSNGTTYDNVCVFQRTMCQLRANFTLYHPGSCTGFPSQKGRHQLRHNPSWAEAVCEQVPLSPYVFYPDKPVHVQVSVNHANFTDPAYVHEAIVAWVEAILDSNFTVCVTQAGRNKKNNGETFASVDWLAYQGAPVGGVSGEVDMPTWWTGTACQSVSLPSIFQSAPTVLLSAEHERSGVKYDASTVWVEDVTSFSFKICVRELQNFDGAHESIYINWLAFEELHQPLFREHGSVYFPNGNKPSKELSYAFCDDLSFERKYNNSPAVLLTANHSTSGANLDPMYNSISAWIEYVNVTGFRVCVKEVFANQRHDPLSVSYAVMPDVCEPGWTFYNSSCYYTSQSCDSWFNASRICRGMGANLVTVESQEENVYVQQRHNGAKAWIGLNDIATEGFFTWVDGCPDNFRYWAPKQPNDFRGEDCVHTLGLDHGYMWNDVQCSSCHQYTCKKDYDDCTSTPCLNGGTCVNKKGNFSCICPHTHYGRTCDELNECFSTPCLHGGTCTDGANNYTCNCPSPFYGHQCQEIDDCQPNLCQNGGTCVDGKNSFTCLCTRFFTGANCTVPATTSCKSLQLAGHRSSGRYYLNVAGSVFQVYCDMSANGGGWTLISRFSNADNENWIDISGSWWYDRISSYGSTTSPSSNYDMISPAFWLVKGNQVKITRSDDASNTGLLYTVSGCIGWRSFRSFITSFGNFRNGQVWNSNACRRSCFSYFGGNYLSTAGFSQAHCSSNLQSSHYLSFWCDWGAGDGAVMMIGGGGSSCRRADHGIGITEHNEAQFGNSSSYCGGYCGDFGDDSNIPSSYSLNLWIK